MGRAGPKSAESQRAENVLIPGIREPAPRDLEPEAAVLWEAIVIRLPADFFTSETRPLLKAYCRHSMFADHFAREIAEVRAAIELIERAISKGRAGVRRLSKLHQQLHNLHKMHGYETDHAISCATRLRITNQSRFVPEKAATMSKSVVGNAPAPWHDWGKHASSTEN